MSFKFGFEVEGFFVNNEDVITLPPERYNHDDFPGLAEARTVGGDEIDVQYYMMLMEMDKLTGVDFSLHQHTFTPREKASIRARHYEKGGVSINNVYGKAPKSLGNKTIASFQINFSDLSEDLNLSLSNNSQFRRKLFRIFDFVEIIRNLDEEFRAEITDSGRQPGFYSVKDGVRVEYRSLPNFVVTQPPQTVIKRIKKCF